jgi:hypothetical protein
MNANAADRLMHAEAEGFDLSYVVDGTNKLQIQCSQCAACVINGVPCHETGCRNQVYECRGCNAVVERRGAYCTDCQ